MNKLIIGSGKLAHHFKFYLQGLGQNPLTWDRSQNTETLNQLLENSSHVYLAISDRAIEPFINTHLFSFAGNIVHFSGALSVPNARYAHPMMTFGPELYSLDFYKKIYFAVEVGTHLSQLIPGIPNPSFTIQAADKGLYHSLCVASGNLPQILWTLVLEESKKLQLPEEALHLFIQQSAANWIEYHEKALTGPIVRKDWATVEKNLASLDQSKIKPIYQEFIRTLE